MPLFRSFFGGTFSRRVAGGVVVGPDGRIAVVNQHGNSWSLPKGHVELGETDEVAAEREIYEETGVHDLILIKKLGEYERPSLSKDGRHETPGTKTRVFFLYHTTQSALQPLDPDNPQAVWVDKADVADLLTHPKDKIFFRSILGEI